MRKIALMGAMFAAASAFAGRTIYIHPSAAANLTNTWNKCSFWNSNNPKVYSSLKDSERNATGVSFFLMAPAARWANAASATFTGDAAEFEAARKVDKKQLYWQNGTATLKVTGLIPACTYSFTFVASRVNDSTSTRYDADYTVAGANNGTVTYNPRSNRDQVARVSGIRPDKDGKATITIKRNSANTTSYYYLLAYKISREALTVTGSHAVAVDATTGGSVRAVLFETWARGGKEETSVVAPVGQAFGKDGFAAELYAGDLYHADGHGVELAAMVLFNTIYGEFIEEKTTYADVLAAGATVLTESEWKRLARYAHNVFIHGCTIIFR